MGNYTSHNSKAFKDGLNDYAERVIKVKLGDALRDVAQKMVDAIDGAFTPDGEGNDQYPVWTGQLHDATGVGVYVDGSLNRFLPTKKGTEPQTDEESGIMNIVGSELLESALNDASSKFSQGVWIVVFSAVPYAYRINTEGSPRGRGQGFFERVKSLLIDDVFAGLKPIVPDLENPYSLGL